MHTDTHCNSAHQNNPNNHTSNYKHHMTSHNLHLNIENLHHMDKTVNLIHYAKPNNVQHRSNSFVKYEFLYEHVYKPKG